MKNLFDAATAEEVKQRTFHLEPDSPRLWGTMNAPQALAHCSVGLEMALGDSCPPRKFVGRIVGAAIKRLVFRDDAPMRRNSPTVDAMIINDERSLAAERERLCRLIDRFSTGGPAVCTTHPHAFFGRLSPQQWAILMYKHLDHHLRQFGV